PVGIDLVRIESLGLDENLVRALVGEANHLVLDRGAVTRTDALDHAGEHGRAVTCRANDGVGPLICLCYETIYLLWVLIDAPDERKHGRRLIAGLDAHH